MALNEPHNGHDEQQHGQDWRQNCQGRPGKRTTCCHQRSQKDRHNAAQYPATGQRGLYRAGRRRLNLLWVPAHTLDAPCNQRRISLQHREPPMLTWCYAHAPFEPGQQTFLRIQQLLLRADHQRDLEGPQHLAPEEPALRFYALSSMGLDLNWRWKWRCDGPAFGDLTDRNVVNVA